MVRKPGLPAEGSGEAGAAATKRTRGPNKPAWPVPKSPALASEIKATAAALGVKESVLDNLLMTQLSAHADTFKGKLGRIHLDALEAKLPKHGLGQIPDK